MSPESPYPSTQCSPSLRKVLGHHNAAVSKEITCFITEADSKTHTISVNQKVLGRELLRKISKVLGFTEEAEYFGLQYQTSKKEILWLNLRNRIDYQLPGHPPYHLFLRIKFYVAPHRLLLEETRHQFYKNVVNHLMLGSWDQEIDMDLHARFIAIMTQVTFGDYNATISPSKHVSFWPELWTKMPPQMLTQIAKHHQQMSDTPINTLQYELLQKAVENLRWYGNFFYAVEDCWGKSLILSVGPEGMLLSTTLADKEIKENYGYPRIQNVTVSDRVVALSVVEDNHNIKRHGFQLSSREAANALYRYSTESHSFYHCSTVKDNVLRQTTGDLRIKLADLFSTRESKKSHNKVLQGEKHNNINYMFDVLHTSREVYDHARRQLYNGTIRLNDQTQGATNVSDTASNSGSIGSFTGSERRGSGISDAPSASSRHQEIKLLQEQVNQLMSATQCCVCLTNQIERVFYPCGHPVCCSECSTKVEFCPYCRQTIEQNLHFYLTLPILRHPVSPSGSSSAMSYTMQNDQSTMDENKSNPMEDTLMPQQSSSGCDNDVRQFSMT